MTQNDWNEAGIDGQENRTDYYKTTDRPITEEEIDEVIRHLKKNKANRQDGILGVVLKHADLIPFVKQYLNDLFDLGFFPDFLSQSITVPIYKRGDADSRGSYRGVST